MKGCTRYNAWTRTRQNQERNVTQQAGMPVAMSIVSMWVLCWGTRHAACLLAQEALTGCGIM